MYEFKFPFEPPMEDLKMVVKTEHATCYIFDTFCKNTTPEEKKRIDDEIREIYRKDAIHKAMEDLNGTKHTTIPSLRDSP